MTIGPSLFSRTIAVALLSATALMAPPAASAETFQRLDQKWTADEWNAFYTGDQGSQVIPLSWIKALKQPDGQDFLADSLNRYGYLPNPVSSSNPAGLPVGFTAAGASGQEQFGMTCAACHTRQITHKGESYRVDGGPAIVDFQSFMADLDAAVASILADPVKFAAFAKAVLGSKLTPVAETTLKTSVTDWYERYHILVIKALPTPAWGPSRLDAVSMIFNRLTGLDLGAEPSHLIPENIQVADAPVRYPFLWNASIQDKTQWPGFADNGFAILGLARNLGEVYGVFGTFHPHAAPLNSVNYIKENSGNFEGLGELEKLIESLGPPKFPWPVNEVLVAQGKTIFDRNWQSGGCVECHKIDKNFITRTWKTPLQDVGTDSREYSILGRTAKTGVLEGRRKPFTLTSTFAATETSFSLLSAAVTGAIAQHLLLSGFSKPKASATLSLAATAPAAAPTAVPADSLEMPDAFLQSDDIQRLMQVFKAPNTAPKAVGPTLSAADPFDGTYKYESRVMEGVWAAAPFLHNGSVPTLAELLKPAAERVQSFKIGPEYDPVAVGLAVEQTKFDYTLTTTGCDQRNSGYSRCGHEFGTSLTADEKKALLEYLKVL